MITQQEDREIIRSGAFKEQHFKLAQNAHIFKILRDGIYSDKALAVIREYWANARDEHVKMGKPELPVEITLPTTMSPYLKIRDFGKGLTQKEVSDVYISYGTSTKTDSNDFIGALGIGSKSAFCYTSAFQVTSFQNGKAYLYSCYIDETEMGKMAHVSTDSTTAPDGVEISVPINNADFGLFATKVKQLFLYAKHRPKIKGWSTFKFDEPASILSGKDWSFINSESSKSFCVMGDVPYVFDKAVFSSTYQSVVATLRKEIAVNQEVEVEEGKRTHVDVESVFKYPTHLTDSINRLLSHHLVIRFNIGEIDMAASREALSYKAKTILCIYDKLTAIVSDIAAMVKKDVDNCKTAWDARLLYARYRGEGNVTPGSLYYAFTGTRLMWNGIMISEDYVRWLSCMIKRPPLPVVPPIGKDGKPITDPMVLAAMMPPVAPDPLSCIMYDRKANGQMRKVNSGEITAHARTRVILNDTGVARGVHTAMSALIPRLSNTSIYVFQYLNQENHDAIVKFFTDVGIPFEYLSKIDIPKAPKDPNRTYSTKHNKKIFAFNGNTGGKSSDAWDFVDVDLDEDEGVYVVIDRYAPVFDKTVAKLDSLAVVKAFIEDVEKKPIIIYGVREKHLPELGNGWMKLDKYCFDLGAKIMNNVDYEQIVADYNHLEEHAGRKHLVELFLGIYKHNKDILPPASKIHEIHKPIRILVDNFKTYKEKTTLTKVLSILGKSIAGGDKKPTCESNVLLSGFINQYPMLRYSESTFRNYCDRRDKDKYISDAAAYIKQVET